MTDEELSALEQKMTLFAKVDNDRSYPAVALVAGYIEA